MSHEPAVPTPITVLRRRTMVLGSGILLVVLGVAVLLTLATGDGTPSFRRAVAFAAVVCGSGAIAGWLVSHWPCRDPVLAVAVSLMAVLFRLATPLVALAWLQTGGQTWRAAGADRLVAGFYLVLLATDIVLNILWGEKRVASRGATLPN